MSNLVSIQAEIGDAVRPPFQFDLEGGKEKFELPALVGGGVPLDILPAALIVTKQDPTPDESRNATLMITAYIQQRHPKLWRHVASHPTPVLLLNGLMRAWAAHSTVTDPKA